MGLPPRPLARDFATLVDEVSTLAAAGRAGLDAALGADFAAGFFDAAARRAGRGLLGILGG
jgi:hypothetical protein